jgi:hypothetical protein
MVLAPLATSAAFYHEYYIPSPTTPVATTQLASQYNTSVNQMILSWGCFIHPSKFHYSWTYMLPKREHY